jgi:hypothetical protein
MRSFLEDRGREHRLPSPQKPGAGLCCFFLSRTPGSASPTPGLLGHAKGPQHRAGDCTGFYRIEIKAPATEAPGWLGG